MNTEELIEVVKHVKIDSDTALLIADKYINYLYLEMATRFGMIVILFATIGYVIKRLIDANKEGKF